MDVARKIIIYILQIKISFLFSAIQIDNLLTISPDIQN